MTIDPSVATLVAGLLGAAVSVGGAVIALWGQRPVMIQALEARIDVLQEALDDCNRQHQAATHLLHRAEMRIDRLKLSILRLGGRVDEPEEDD